MSKTNTQTATQQVYEEPESYYAPVMSNSAESGAQPDHANFNWQRAKRESKTGLDSAFHWAGQKLGVPMNKASNRWGSETFWPTSLDKESDKAARILKSFCQEGFYTEQPQPSTEGPSQKSKVLVTIPQKVIENAYGLAIFTTARVGWHFSGAGGSGVLIARLPDGSWSPPSGLIVHTLGVGFMAGIDVYDCVLVINSPQALDSFKRMRVTLGGEMSIAAGPVGVGGKMERNVDLRKDDKKAIFVYMKSRGLYAGVQIDGTFMVERNDENARFYGERVSVADIVAGKVRTIPASTRGLMETLKGAEGKAAAANFAGANGIVQEAMPPYSDYEKNTAFASEVEVTRDEKKGYSDNF